MRLDPNRTWQGVEARLGGERDPVVRRNLELVLAHMRAEARGDIDGVLETLGPRPRYITHALPGVPQMNPEGSLEAVREFYRLTILETGAHRLEFDCSRVVADREAVVTEGVMRMAYPGRTLRAMGTQVDDEGAFYLYEAAMCVLWPIDPASGRLRGEETWTAGDGFAGIAGRKIRAADIAPLRG